MKAPLQHRKIKDLMKKVKTLELSLQFIIDSLDKLELSKEQMEKFNLILEELKAKI